MIFLFTEIDHPEVFEKRGNPDAAHILSCQYFLIEEILYNHGVYWMKRTPKGVLAAFGDGESPDSQHSWEDSAMSSQPAGSPDAAAPFPKAPGFAQATPGAPGNGQGRPGEAVVALLKDFENHLWGQFGKAKLKAALHAGKAEAAGQNYVGPEVNHALKVLDAAPSGQTLLTVPAVHFIPLPPGSRLKDMGRHFLKDLTEPQTLYALLHPDLDNGETPPPRSLGNYPQNFFPQSSPFFGREEEMLEIAGLLAAPQTRLVTLTGPGGFGKTRLAFQAAAETVEKFKDGVFIVALAPLLSDHLLIANLAHAVKFSFYGPEDPKAQLLGHLKDKQMLLVMDNFEHVIEGAELVREILSEAPALKVLATSRESLGIDGEKVFEVGGLRYPPAGDAAQMEASSAVQLFLKSARRVQPHFTLTPRERGPLLDICRFLEGMPLGLELSATWVGTLSLQEIVGKIESSRDFLATSMPHLPPRHRSVRAVFEYSWILLTEPQKKALKSISVFHGGFTAEAVRKVAGAGEELLEKLAQKSLVRRKGNRWEIHELLKYYAKEKLFDDPGEKEKSFDAHSRYFSQWMRKRERDLTGSRQQKVLEEMVEEIGNIREGWRRALEKRMVEEMEGYLEPYYLVLETKGWFQEGREAFRQAAESIRESFPEGLGSSALLLLLARLLCRWADFERDLGNTPQAGKLLGESLGDFQSASAPLQAGYAQGSLAKVFETQGDYKNAKALFAKSLATFQKNKDRHGQAWALNELGHMESLAGNYKDAQGLIHRSLAHSQAWGDRRSVGHSYVLMGDALYGQGLLEESKRFYQKGLEAYLESGDRRGMSWAFINLGRAAELLGDYSGARQMYREGMDIAKDMGDRRGLAWADNLLGFTHWATGDYQEAQRFFEEGLALYREIGDHRGQAWTLDLMGNIKLAQREDKEAEECYRQARELVLKEGMNTQNKAWDAFHQGALAAFRGANGEAARKLKESLRLFQSIRDGLGQLTCLLQLGEVSLALGDRAAAEAFFRKAGAMALERHLPPFLPDILVGVAQMMKAQGEEGQALGLLMVALSHPTCRRQTKDRVVSFTLALESHFPAEEVAGFRQWAKAARIEDVVGAWVSGRGMAEKKKAPRKRRAARKPRRPPIRKKRSRSKTAPKGRPQKRR